MSNIIKHPAAARFKSVRSHQPDHEGKFLLIVEDSGQVRDFLELLELIYGSRLEITHKQGDLARMWVSFIRQPQHSLAGVRVAARVCGVEFEEVSKWQ